MSTITRVVIVLLSSLIALALAFLWVLADCGLEPTMCESVRLLSKLSKTWVVAIPFLIIAFIPNRYNKILMGVRFMSVIMIGFILLMGLNNTINMILSEKNSTVDIIFGPILSLVAFCLTCLILLPEIKYLIKKYRGRAKVHATESL